MVSHGAFVRDIRHAGARIVRDVQAAGVTTSFPSDAWSALVVCAWCAGYVPPGGDSDSDLARSLAVTRTSGSPGPQWLPLPVVHGTWRRPARTRPGDHKVTVTKRA